MLKTSKAYTMYINGGKTKPPMYNGMNAQYSIAMLKTAEAYTMYVLMGVKILSFSWYMVHYTFNQTEGRGNGYSAETR